MPRLKVAASPRDHQQSSEQERVNALIDPPASLAVGVLRVLAAQMHLAIEGDRPTVVGLLAHARLAFAVAKRSIADMGRVNVPRPAGDDARQFTDEGKVLTVLDARSLPPRREN